MLPRLSALLLSLTACHGLYFEVHQGPEYRIVADTLFPLTLGFGDTANGASQSELVSPLVPLATGLVVIPTPQEDWNLSFENGSIYFSAQDLFDGANKTIMVSAYFWGYWQLSFYARPPNYEEMLQYNISPLTRTIKAIPTKSSVQTINTVEGQGDIEESSSFEEAHIIDNNISTEAYQTLLNSETDFHDADEELEESSGDGDITHDGEDYNAGSSLLGFFNRVRRDIEDENEVYLLTNATVIVVDRKPASKTMDDLFVGTAVTFMLLNTVNMGCQLNVDIILSVLKKPIGPAVGVVSQFFFMPCFSFFIGWILLNDPLRRLGLFVLGCCPGGNASNFWTLLFGGDLNLSITMTFISTIIAMVMMPFWMMTLGSLLIDEESSFQVPYLNLFLSLVSLTIPIAIGLLIKYKKPSWALISAKLVKPMTFCLVTFLLTMGIYNNWKAMLMMTWNMALAGLLVALGGYSAGALLSTLFCLKKKQIIAISIETAFQNAAIAVVLMKLSLPTPESDLATVPAMAQIFQTGPPLLFVYLGWQVLQRCGYCIPDQDDAEDSKRPGYQKNEPATALTDLKGDSRPENKEELDPMNPFYTRAYPKLPPYSENP